MKHRASPQDSPLLRATCSYIIVSSLKFVAFGFYFDRYMYRRQGTNRIAELVETFLERYTMEVACISISVRVHVQCIVP
jgi:hypothetical protein